MEIKKIALTIDPAIHKRIMADAKRGRRTAAHQVLYIVDRYYELIDRRSNETPVQAFIYQDESLP